MEFKEFLQKLYSEREFDSRKVEQDKLDELMSYAKEVENSNGIQNIDFVMFEDGVGVFNKLKGAGGYGGVMINSPHYIGIRTNYEGPKANMITGYAGQSVIKKAFELGLATCWVDLNDTPEDIKKELAVGLDKSMDYIIALGYSNNSNKRKEASKINVVSDNPEVSNNPYSITTVEGTNTSGGRLSIVDIVYIDEWGNNIDFNELENRGLADLFYYVKNAPSYKNEQPWRFIIKGGEVFVGVIDLGKKGSYTDAGIIMFMLKGLAHEMSIPGEWQYLDPEVGSYKGEEYAIVGKFNI